MADYRFRVVVTIIGETNMKTIRDYIVNYLKDQKAKGNVKSGMWDVFEEPAVEPYRESGEI